MVLIGHSLGCLFTYYFLQTQSQAWKDKYIDSYVSISGPYIGAVKSLKAIISGIGTARYELRLDFILNAGFTYHLLIFIFQL